MAPGRIDSMREDDFILTISDDDEDVPNVDYAKIESSRPRPTNKRKRDVEDGVTLKVQSKKQKSRLNGAHDAQEELEEEPQDRSDEQKAWADGGEDDGDMASDFEFQSGGLDTEVIDDFDGWNLQVVSKARGTAEKKGVDIDEIVARRKAVAKDARDATDSENEAEEPENTEAETQNTSDDDVFVSFDDEDDETLAPDGFGMGVLEDEEAHEDGLAADGSNSSESGDDSSEVDAEAEPVAHPDDVASEMSEEETEDPKEAERQAAFFASEDAVTLVEHTKNSDSGSFQAMSLSRPIMKGLAAVGFATPTPIQHKTIPVALLGKDVVGGAETGSGKTAAFVIPILERLLYRPKKIPTTRVVILMPTRELAVQCFNVAKKLASFTDITFALIVGGFSLREQENVLKNRPDVVIATPGRFIDHMRNSASFAVDSIEILVLDEADRMLEDGFADELNEILTTIPKSRQTMLFSATMTNSVDKLIRAGLNRPVRLVVNARKRTVQGLVQEFVRLRPGREDKRLAYLLWLCENVYTQGVIVFFRQKKEAHRVRIVFALHGLKAVELHGSMTQEQRISSVEAFRAGTASYLLATDLASRGLDIKGVETVINYEAPQSHEIYLHRVGRTARAGRSGRSCTIAAEPDRKVVKAAVKAAREQGAKIASRVVPLAEADAWAKKLIDMESEVEAVLKEEKEEKVINQAERDVRKGENFVEYEKEIMSRPKRTWFESEKEKKRAKQAGWRELNAGNGIGDPNTKNSKKKLSNKEKKRLDLKDERKGSKIWKKGKGDAASVKAGKKQKVKGKTGNKPSRPR